MPSNIVSKDSSSPNHAAIWEIINAAVLLAQAQRATQQLPIIDFKISRRELQHYISLIAQNAGYDTAQDFVKSKKLAMSDLENSLIILQNKTIALDYNPSEGNYKERYINFGNFGRVKTGIDETGALYAIKTERKRDNAASLSELDIMKEIGVLVGEISRQTTTSKLWLDKKSIHEKSTLVMQLRTGIPLNDFFDKKGPHYRQFNKAEKMLIALGLVKTIKALNDKGIAHRDIQPCNILLDINQLPLNITPESMQAYLEGNLEGYEFKNLIKEVDWGLAQKMAVDGTEVDLPIGHFSSVGHTAPESYLNRKLSIHSEVFSVSHFIDHYLELHFKKTQDNAPLDLRYGLSNFEVARDAVIKLRKENENPEKENDFIFKNKLLQAEQKLKFLTAELTTLLQKYPPENRHSLNDLFDEIRHALLQQFENIIDIDNQPTLKPLVGGYVDDPSEWNKSPLIGSYVEDSQDGTNSLKNKPKKK